jgi:hypothetical protein
MRQIYNQPQDQYQAACGGGVRWAATNGGAVDAKSAAHQWRWLPGWASCDIFPHETRAALSAGSITVALTPR